MTPMLGIMDSQKSGHLLTVTGGTLYTVGGYNYRVFTSSGTLTVTGGTLTASLCSIGAGAGGGAGRGGGGGAGEIDLFASFSLAAASYTVTIGAGGTASNASVEAATAVLQLLTLYSRHLAAVAAEQIPAFFTMELMVAQAAVVQVAGAQDRRIRKTAARHRAVILLQVA